MRIGLWFDNSEGNRPFLHGKGRLLVSGVVGLLLVAGCRQIQEAPPADVGIPQSPSGGVPVIIRPRVSAEATSPLPTATPSITLPTDGIWISDERLASLPTSGEGWENVLEAADEAGGFPNLQDQDQADNVNTLAKALVYARTGEESYREEVYKTLQEVIGTECGQSGNIACPDDTGARSLAVGRELGAYVVAADLINLHEYAPEFDDTQFRPWLEHVVRRTNSEGRSIIGCQEDRPNNWGTHCGFSRLVTAFYLGDAAEVERSALVFRGFIGDREAYSDFTYGDRAWQCDPDAPSGINPYGCTIDGYDVGGVIPDDQRRCGSFAWPPCKTNYAWTSLQGLFSQAVVLDRLGYDVWNWEDQALLRSIRWLHLTTFDDGQNYAPVGDDEWLSYLVNSYYNSTLAVNPQPRPGKIMGWTEWTHAASGNP